MKCTKRRNRCAILRTSLRDPSAAQRTTDFESTSYANPALRKRLVPSLRYTVAIKQGSRAMKEQYLTFFIRSEEYAVGILRVKEIIEYETVTRVPAMPVHVRGVINLRGAVLPVIDLAAKFGHGESAPARTTCIVVVETQVDGELLVVGLVADSVSEVVDLTSEQIEPPPP